MIIDGKGFAADMRVAIKAEVESLKSQTGKVPGLAVILVGEDPASQVYVRNKGKQTIEAGMNSFEIKLNDDVSQESLIEHIQKLNQDDKVHGILVQLPLPNHIDELAVIDAIDPAKDVDGFHVINSGKLATGQRGLVPCTPLGCSILIKDVLGEDLSGKNALVIGRSNIVGKPMAALLLDANATVTIAHSRTKNLPELCKQADIVVAAVGRPKMVQGDWLKQGAVVIDVGINRTAENKLVGDVDFESASKIASHITPVPGGVGPMTIACLLQNTVTAFKNLISDF